MVNKTQTMIEKARQKVNDLSNSDKEKGGEPKPAAFHGVNTSDAY